MEWVRATSALLRPVLMATTLIIHTLARLTVITALTGLSAACLLAPARGTTAGMDAGFMAVLVITDADGQGEDTVMADAVDLTAEALEADSTEAEGSMVEVDSTEAEDTTVEVDSMAAEDFTVAAGLTEAEAMGADTVKRKLQE